MTINFILNGEDVSAQAEAGGRLIDILRKNFGLKGAKSNCHEGQCGSCTVIFNGQVSLACLIPAFKVTNSEIITIEGFSQTIEYQEITEGFKQADLFNCAYCLPAKILCTEALLDRIPNPQRNDILMGFKGIKCRCTIVEDLIKAIGIIADIRQRRLYGRSA
jgi:carbon-monoxide dehydrogenase small subunit